MSWFRDIIWGAVQGITEFLPVSSSAHLVFLSHFLKIGHHVDHLPFFVGLHFGTLLSLLVFFKRRIFCLLRDVVYKRDTLALKLILITLITGGIGFFLEKWTEILCEYPRVVAGNLVAMGTLLLSSRFLKVGDRTLEELTWFEAIGLALVQSIAVFPGISRSGITIIYLLYIGMNPSDAFILSFLSGIPVIFMAFLWSLIKVGLFSMFSAWLAIISSFGFGILALILLRRVVIARKLYYFGIYCWIVSMIVCWLIPR